MSSTATIRRWFHAVIRRRLCGHLSCRMRAAFAQVVRHQGSGRQAGYRTAYIYPNACYRRLR